MAFTDRPRTWLGGTTAGLLLTMGLLAGLAAACSISGRQLRYDSGDRPVQQTVSRGGKFADPVYAYVWDVRHGVDSTFTVPSGFGTGEAWLLSSTVRVSVPEGCTDHTVHWQVTADGEHRIGQGTTRWLRQYDETFKPRPHGLRPRTVTVEAWWDGGDAACPSFSFIWQDPTLYFEADPDFLDGDYYPT
ncbi:hypothetical protein ABTZ21_27090 [Streptomyces sp. NPDC096191]|uniref:hypothetical protein n=1 Tax=Streptomyces sp. NPDC096191 TaxID=3155426 RepID=UPI00332039EB